ncbi:putative pilus system protein FilA [Acinetobacter kyonggiensis]|uniref:DUF6160 domain-containing protein n=1 Tax=Acinetobacter kyonggiensis TaxID=595670 RepID=A0A1H3LPV1_9GAMM|nr:DUF6160 family protein [Acinetobacter kyonggiensis]SDY66431.1 hypothetical protein SAMN05421643_11945 [Acinetobacter kyonggiensis]
MKKFTKLALVSSLAISANAMAMQAMDDASLGATTGQDGINIGIGISKIQIEKLYIHDNDGLSATAKNTVTGTKVVMSGTPPAPGFAANALVSESAIVGGTGVAGAIVIKGNGKTGDVNKDHGIVITANTQALLASHNLADLQIDSDAGTGANGAFINIAAQVSGLDISIGEIGVTASGTAGAGSLRRGGDDTNYNAILSGLTLKTGQMAANIQLGAAPQGAMIKLNTKMVGGLEIKNLGILDNSTKQGVGDGTAGNRAAGEIFVESIKVADANSTDLTINQNISVMGKDDASNGYIRMVSSSGPIDTYVKGVHLGSRTAGSIGDVEVQGLQTYFSPALGSYVPGSIITISGR